MATTRIIPMHHNKGKTIAQCLSDRTDYAMNPEKTEGGKLISAYECDPDFASSQFQMAKKQYFDNTGRIQHSDVIAYQLRQSFKPGEVTPEEANQIGCELAARFTKGEHAYIYRSGTHPQSYYLELHVAGLRAEVQKLLGQHRGNTSAF